MNVPEYTAVRHILRAPPIARRTAPYVLADQFDWDGLARETTSMSGGETLLVRIAQELWSAEKITGLWELPRRLDDRNFERVIQALRLCRDVSALDVAAEPLDGEEEFAA